MIRVSGIVEESIVDGPGLRLVVFAQGCGHNCLGCHNPDTHSFNGGYDIAISEIVKRVESNPLLDGITFSGGDPFEQADMFYRLGIEIKELGLNILTYTGYTYEEITKSDNRGWNNLLKITDILIEGPFQLDNRSMELKFRGSSNQRIIDTKTGNIIRELQYNY